MLKRVTLFTFIALTFILTSCNGHSAPPQKIVLFAPFEGRYQEVGYSALYSARLAFTDHNPADVQLVALDDGGMLEIAIERAKAIAYDEQIQIVIVQGDLGASADVLAHLIEKTVIIVGDWGDQTGDHVYHLSNPAIHAQLTHPQQPITDPISAPFIGGETFGLPSFIQLQPNFQALTFISSGGLPSAEFEARILASAPHPTPPNHLSMLTYDAVSMAIQALNQNVRLSDITTDGISGQITFLDGYWAEAPIYHYGFDADGAIYSITP